MKIIQSLMIVAAVALFSACATVTPTALLNARSAYQHASASPASQMVPAELHKAYQALALAEKSFKSEHDTYRTRDLSYIAQRKAELAEVLSSIAMDKTSKGIANADFVTKQGEMLKQGKEDLADQKKFAADAVVAMATEKAAKDLSDSEKRTADALAELAKLTAVKEEERGLVITLSGSVLFKSAESTLLPSAQTKLDQVGTALLSVRERNIIVEGYTDSQGSRSYNQGLSQRRADSVRTYLVNGGYPADRIQAHGMGMDSPIADNASPEGRANNRRVEIIIEREQGSSSH